MGPGNMSLVPALVTDTGQECPVMNHANVSVMPPRKHFSPIEKLEEYKVRWVYTEAGVEVPIYGEWVWLPEAIANGWLIPNENYPVARIEYERAEPHERQKQMAEGH